MSRIGQARFDAIAPDKSRIAEQTGIGAGTLVLTLDGELPVDHLTEGDRVITRSGARTLRRITSREVRGAWLIRPHTLGHDRPEAEVALGPGQQVLLRDWRARALYGKDQATVPVARLADGDYIRPARAPVRVWRLEFDQAEVIYAGGLELAAPAVQPADL